MRDLPEGTVIDRASVTVAEWPVGTTPAGGFASIDSVAGRVTRVSVFKGEALVPGRFAPPGTDAGLDIRITPGKRAFGLRVNDVSGIAGLIQPNSRVDILVVINGAEWRRVAKLLMENMRVLTIGTEVQRSEDRRPISAVVVTVEVTPKQAERLAIAMTQGQIQLALRGYGDPDSVIQSKPDLLGPCAKPDGRVILRDLLQRSCPRRNLIDKRDAAAVVVSPGR